MGWGLAHRSIAMLAARSRTHRPLRASVSYPSVLTLGILVDRMVSNRLLRVRFSRGKHEAPRHTRPSRSSPASRPTLHSMAATTPLSSTNRGDAWPTARHGAREYRSKAVVDTTHVSAQASLESFHRTSVHRLFFVDYCLQEHIYMRRLNTR